MKIIVCLVCFRVLLSLLLIVINHCRTVYVVSGIAPKLLVTNETTLVIYDMLNDNKHTVSVGGLTRAVDFDYLSNTVFWIDSTSRSINL